MKVNGFKKGVALLGVVCLFVTGCAGTQRRLQLDKGPTPVPCVEGQTVGCQVCGKCFDSVADLQRHMKLGHILCPECRARGETLYLLNQEEYEAHYKEAHKDIPASMSFWMGAYVVVVGGGYSTLIIIASALI